MIPQLAFPNGLFGIVLLCAHTFAILYILARHWSGLSQITSWRLLALAIGMLVAPILSTRISLDLGNISLPTSSGTLDISHRISLSPLAYIPVVLAAVWFGMLPSMLLAASGGLGRALLSTHSLFTVTEWMIAAFILSVLMHHKYRGRLAVLLRQPFAASLTTTAIAWPLGLLSLTAENGLYGLSGNDYLFTFWRANGLTLFGELSVAGLVAELVRFTIPGVWAKTASKQPLTHSTKLNQRLLRALAPLVVAGVVALYWANTRIATNVATKLVLEQMVRDADHAAAGIPFFFRTGESLIMELSQSDELWNGNSDTRESQLSKGIRTIPYFQQLVYFDASGIPVAGYPQPDITSVGLTTAEIDAVEVALRGAPQHTLAFPVQRDAPVLLSFVAPVDGAQHGVPVGALLGRTDIARNPLMIPITDSLQGLLVGSGTGFITDQRHRIIFHPDPLHLQEIWEPSDNKESIPVTSRMGTAYRDRNNDGTHWLVYHLPVSGHPWNVVIVVPNSAVLAQATQITVPLALLLIVAGMAGIGILLVISGRITRPLGTLAVAAEGIMQGEFSQPVRVQGHDEVGRLGEAFERMRKRLRAQVDELGLLLQVSQAVAGSLDLRGSIPAILQGALQATEAAGVRLILKSPERSRDNLQTFHIGSRAEDMAPLDPEILSLAEIEGQILIEHLARARAVLDVSKIDNQIQAMIALPLLHETNYLGVLWLGYGHPRRFTQAEINLLATIAWQAAIAVANARLFEASEGDRQQLVAILASTPDAVIVTDHSSRLLLGNPAAEEIFGINIASEAGRLLSEVITQSELLSVMRGTDGTPSTREIPFPDGRTFSASASPILRSDSSVLGRVAVLRDVTHFKRLDQFKSDAVAAVSHDLKSPLTIIKGCAGMLPMVGQLNPRQQEYADQIENEIDRMSQEIDDLLDLYRIESGGDVSRELCDISDLINSVTDKVQDVAASKGIKIEIDLAPQVDSVRGDQSLLRQAISRLVDNSLKYTQTAGQLRVSTEMRNDYALIAVQDNGVGISSTDQDYVFEKFFRVRGQEVDAPSGSGLGLAFVKSIIERHGGRVWVESQLGQGSTFFITIPSG